MTGSAWLLTVLTAPLMARPASAQTLASEDLVKALRQGGYVLVMRSHVRGCSQHHRTVSRTTGRDGGDHQRRLGRREFVGDSLRAVAEYVAYKTAAGSKDVQISGDIIARIDALNDLMKDLLLFARPPQPRVAAVDVLSLLKNVRDLLRQDPALRGLRIDVTGDAIVLPADPELLKIVVQNLLLNGAHALQGQG